MRQQTTKKFFAFIIIVTILFLLPHLGKAQGPKCGQCPKDFYCDLATGYCVKIWKGPACPKCPYSLSISSTLISDATENSSTISFHLIQAQNVSAKIYDATGRLIKTLLERQMIQGEYQIEWDAKNEQGNAVQTGIYFLQLNTGSKTETRKVSIIR